MNRREFLEMALFGLELEADALNARRDAYSKELARITAPTMRALPIDDLDARAAATAGAVLKRGGHGKT